MRRVHNKHALPEEAKLNYLKTIAKQGFTLLKHVVQIYVEQNPLSVQFENYCLGQDGH